MAEQNKNLDVDIAIFGAGIAGLWLFNQLRSAGYNAVLLETDAIGGGQTIASQGIIHSGLKYAFAGKINALAKSISAMPDSWREALNGEGPVDLSAAKMSASSQYLLIPKGFMGGLLKLVTKQILGGNVREVPRTEWPESIEKSGFNGNVIYMDEPVLDVPSLIRALAEPYTEQILKIESTQEALQRINAKLYIYTAAGSNHMIAKEKNDDSGLETQARPLLMGMLKGAPYPLYAHLVGSSEKPVATITTHETETGELVWYLGGAVAERAKDDAPEKVYEAVKKGFSRYLPDIDLSKVQWTTLPIDRIEGKSDTQGWMPDTPTIHDAGDHLYCWPTKLTFAPMLADLVIGKIYSKGILPSEKTIETSAWEKADYAKTPWDLAQWESLDE